MSKYWIGFFSYFGSRDKIYFFTIELSVVDLTRNDQTLVLIYLWGRFPNLGRSALVIWYNGCDVLILNVLKRFQLQWRILICWNMLFKLTLFPKFHSRDQIKQPFVILWLIVNDSLSMTHNVNYSCPLYMSSSKNTKFILTCKCVYSSIDKHTT